MDVWHRVWMLETGTSAVVEKVGEAPMHTTSWLASIVSSEGSFDEREEA